MITRLLSSTGVFPDVTVHDGQWQVVYGESGQGSELRVCRLALDTLEPLGSWPIPGGYARSDPRTDGPWLAYRALAGDVATLLNLDTGISTTAAACVGNAPVEVGSGYWAWQHVEQAGISVLRALLGNPSAWASVRAGAPTGLSCILPDGTVRLIDEDRGAMPGGTMPTFAGDLSVCEAPNGGVLCRLSDGRECLLWPGQVTFTPRCAADGAGRHAVVTWSPTAVQMALLTAADFAAPAPAEPVLADPSLPIDMLPFFVGGEWPHTSGGVQGSLDLKVNLPDRPKSFSFVKWGNPKAQEVYRYTDDAIFHHEDHTDELSEGGNRAWRLTAGKWVHRLVKVGDVIHAVDNFIQRIGPDGRVTSEAPFPFFTEVVAHYSSYPCGGDVGTREVVVVKYDPTESNPNHEGNYELFHFAKGFGWFHWSAYDYHGDVLQQEAVMNLRGGVSVTPAPLLVPLPGTTPPQPALPSGCDVLYPVPGVDVPVLSRTGVHRLMDIHVPPCMVDLKVRVVLEPDGLHGVLETMDGRQLGRSTRPRPVTIEG